MVSRSTPGAATSPGIAGGTHKGPDPGGGGRQAQLPIPRGSAGGARLPQPRVLRAEPGCVTGAPRPPGTVGASPGVALGYLAAARWYRRTASGAKTASMPALQAIEPIWALPSVRIRAAADSDDAGRPVTVSSSGPSRASSSCASRQARLSRQSIRCVDGQPLFPARRAIRRPRLSPVDVAVAGGTVALLILM